MNQVKELTVSSDAPGAKLLMLGNEAIARGAIEAGLAVMASYPGTPSSEIAEAVIGAAKNIDNMYVEWSVNEKVAFEIAFAASMSGVRALTTMKHVGLNVAHDPLMTASYMGTKGGLVLVTADDPSMWSSQNEQDSRYTAMQGYIPVLEPSSGQEAKDMMADAFRLSEEFGQIFMFRTVTRLSHARYGITLGKISNKQRRGHFEKDSSRWVCLPVNERRNRLLMIERMAKIKKAVNTLPYNKLDLAEGAELGIIASGLGYAYMQEALQWLGLEDKVSLLKIGTPYPIPDELTLKLIESVPEVLVVEELEPIVENQVKVLAQEQKIDVTIHGKDVVPLAGELSTRSIVESLSQLASIEPPVDFEFLDKLNEETGQLLPLRPPAMCPGCPHRATFYAEGVAVRRYQKEFGIEPVRHGDIGCYSLGFYPPLNSDDIALCMSGSYGAANGIAQVTGAPAIAHIGDSTFFHSGIPPVINAVYNKANVTFLVLDNAITGQTGFQENPATGLTARGEITTAIKPEDIARACQVLFVEVVDPFDVPATIDTIERALRFDGPALVVTRQSCRVMQQRDMRKRGEKFIPYEVDIDTCTDCRLCVNNLGCPAILIEEEQVVIDASQCSGCGVCAQICPTGAINQKGSK